MKLQTLLSIYIHGEGEEEGAQIPSLLLVEVEAALFIFPPWNCHEWTNSASKVNFKRLYFDLK